MATETITLADEIALELANRKMKQRDLIVALRRYDVELTDTSLSNRMNGFAQFKVDEIEAINKLWNKNYVLTA